MIVNGSSNHTGLAAWNLWLSNVLVMLRYDLRHGGCPYWGWRREFVRVGKALFLGWTPHQIRWRRSEGTT